MNGRDSMGCTWADLHGPAADEIAEAAYRDFCCDRSSADQCDAMMRYMESFGLVAAFEAWDFAINGPLP